MTAEDPIVDWFAMPARSVLASVKAAPPIAGEWRQPQDSTSWRRFRAWPDPSWIPAVIVRPMTPATLGWSYSFSYSEGDYHGGFQTAEEAKLAADEVLRKRKWLLLDVSSQTPSPETEPIDGQRQV